MNKKPPLSVLIADDHRIITDLIATYISESGNFSVHVAKDLSSAMGLCRSSGPFDVVLLDYFMPDMQGLLGVQRMIELNRTGKVVLFSGVESQVILTDALKYGGSGLIPKNIPASEIAEIITRISEGELYLPQWYIQRTDKDYPQALSKREGQVLGYLRGGLTNDEIAELCGISTGTVKLHVKSACTKLGAKNRTQAAMMAEELKL